VSADPTFDADEEAARRPGSVVEYVMDLEALIRWLALTFSWQDPETGEVHVNDPIWTTYDQFGTHLPAAEKLQATWHKVLHDA
jgi:hypothetical protein